MTLNGRLMLATICALQLLTFSFLLFGVVLK
jgi:hypothetical protein